MSLRDLPLSLRCFADAGRRGGAKESMSTTLASMPCFALRCSTKEDRRLILSIEPVKLDNRSHKRKVLTWRSNKGLGIGKVPCGGEFLFHGEHTRMDLRTSMRNHNCTNRAYYHYCKNEPHEYKDAMNKISVLTGCSCGFSARMTAKTPCCKSCICRAL